jgi:hypothetical protein
METGTIRNLLIVIAFFFGVTFAAYQVGRRDGLIHSTEDIKQIVDTMYVRDTITQYKPILEERVVLKKVPYPVTDTLRIHDTLFVYLDREQVVWQDSLSRVYASGILPQIDSVKHFIQERIVTIQTTIPVKKPCRWGIGVQAGYGVQFGDQIQASPYVGIGISYNLLSW